MILAIWIARAMIRALVHSLVLIVAIGPTAATVCKASCDGRSGAAACVHEHQHAATHISSGRQCSDAGISLTPYIKEDLRRGAAASREDALTAVGDFPASAFTVRPSLAEQPRRALPLDTRPLSAALRI